MHSIDANHRATRRQVLGAGLLLGGGTAIAGLLPGAAKAATPAQAQSLVEKVTREIVAIMDKGGSESTVLRSFEGVFDRYADTNIIARTILGVPWRSASNQQKRDFTVALRGYLARKYGRQFRDYKGARVDITGVKDQGTKGIVVSSVVRSPRVAPFEVAWQVSDRSGQIKLFNLFIEGISMLSAERSEVQALLERQRGDIGKLIADLNKRG